jgi:hypothetical protein
MFFTVKKADNSANLAAGGRINHRIYHNSLCRDRQEQTLGDQLCDGLLGSESSDGTSHARVFSCSYISYLKENGGYFPNSPPNKTITEVTLREQQPWAPAVWQTTHLPPPWFLEKSKLKKCNRCTKYEYY